MEWGLAGGPETGACCANAVPPMATRPTQRIRKFASWSGMGGSREPAGAPLQRIEANHAPTSLIGWQSQGKGESAVNVGFARRRVG